MRGKNRCITSIELPEKIFDLTSQERYDHPFDDYDGCVEVGISKKSRDILEKKKDILMKNAGICV